MVRSKNVGQSNKLSANENMGKAESADKIESLDQSMIMENMMRDS
jgi:hypothetical protein